MLCVFVAVLVSCLMPRCAGINPNFPLISYESSSSDMELYTNEPGTLYCQY
jgi:hypothetical protein